MESRLGRRSVFNQVFDVVVVGSGHAGFAAAMTLASSGRSVLLVGAQGDLVWESGRAFHPGAGACDDSVWNQLVDAVAQRGGAAGGWLDGAITEIVATEQLVRRDVSVLYYARPVAVERDGEAVRSLVVATKSGLRRVVGRQWVDATESGELLGLISPHLGPLRPLGATAYLMLQHQDWSRVGARDDLRRTAWPTERVLAVDVNLAGVNPAGGRWREQLLTALEHLQESLGPEIAQVSVSHLSYEPILRWGPDEVTLPDVSNVVAAVPAFAAGPTATLADRFMLGVRAAAALEGRPAGDVTVDVLDEPIARPEIVRKIHADVCVAGVGTGGAVAAIAAARAGATVTCVEAMPFVGGIGTGGGIHGYWFGVPGGLQDEVDRRTRELMKRFDGGPLGDGPFNPWAKMLTLEQLLDELGVTTHASATLFDVETLDGRVVAAFVATPEGVLRIEAASFVDGTGDGDLCALAGAEYTVGREHDGRLHAYTQVTGGLRDLHGRPRMRAAGFDAGFCDPTDPDDLTRARLDGIRQYLADHYDNLTRPTYVAPVIGLRQARQIVTEYVLTLDDQIRRRRFTDPVGYTSSHYDNHGSDYEFDSDEAVFWVWVNRQFTEPVACEISYRMLVPRGLSNVWIASRCLGVTQDAHYITRMQRDIQRAGEAAGFAAALAGRHAWSARELPYAELRRLLDETAALSKEPSRLGGTFGTQPDGTADVEELVSSDGPASAGQAIAALDGGQPGEAVWWLYRHKAHVYDAVLARLGDAGRPVVSWLAAGVVAMWEEPVAQPRLVHAIDSLEYGFGEDFPWPSPNRLYNVTGDFTPLGWNRVVPNWLCAIALLRRCGTAACLEPIARLLERSEHGIDTLSTIAITVERLARRGELAANPARAHARAMLDRILAVPVLGAFDYAERSIGRHSEYAVRGQVEVPDLAEFAAFGPPFDQQLRNTYQDQSWQLHVAVARARVALGLPAHDAAASFHHDDRAYVRRAFAAL